MDDNWQECLVYMDDNKVYKTDSFKYDVFANKLIFLNEGKEFYVPENEKIVSFNFSNFKIRNIIYGSDGTRLFFEILEDNEKLKLLKKHSCKYVQGKTGDGVDPGRNDRYTKCFEYYFVLSGKNADKLKISKKAIFGIMKDREKEMELFISTNKLKISKENDLIRIFNHYGSL